MTVRLTELWTYPVKSLRGVRHASAEVQTCGLAGDRRWMLVDQNSRFLSQRDLPQMSQISAAYEGETVILSAHGRHPLPVRPPRAGAPRPVNVWHDALPALDAGDEAAFWLSAALGASCRLMYQNDPASRPLDPTFARPGDAVNLADGFPVLLTNVESLGDLNGRLAHPVEMLRFRPNLIVQGAVAWAEDGWRRMRIGGVVFRVAKPCDRCIMTTIDPRTGERPDPDEPLRTLKTFRRDTRGRVLFGQNLVPEQLGVLHEGAAVEIE
jgi:uncharacterized protein YcbX